MTKKELEPHWMDAIIGEYKKDVDRSILRVSPSPPETLMFALDQFHAPSIGEIAIILAIALLLFFHRIQPRR